jgi:phenylalanyl-tRNA synthetase beta chain
MQFPESWLREFCNPPLNTQQLADTLTMAGLEVEEMRSVAPAFTKVVIGHIVAAEQHPNADRLRICQVDVGQAEPLSIVCGAPNARVGIKVPCALVGAELPPGEDGKPFLIKLGKLRGVESQGMLCSSRELHLSQEHEGLLELSPEARLGQNIRDHLQLDDTLFTLKLTPNLAHCLSVYGIARELSALTGASLLQPEFSAVHVDIQDVLPVSVEATDLCGRFSGRILKHVNPKAATPAWMVERLSRCGQRSVSALVDISNYVMFELGRPSHIFDLDKINDGLVVRWGKAGETLKLLNGNTVELDDKVGVIADASQVESLAGIMGGDATAVSDDTQHIYIEAAFWWPQAVAGRSRRFNFSTDAGHRFERGVDPEHTVEHIERITRLVLDICGTPQSQVGVMDDHRLAMPVRSPVDMRVARANKVIGANLSQQRMADALYALGLPLVETPGVITVTPPSFRFDITIEEDVIEEVARMVGFDQLPTTPPLAPITPQVRPENQRHPFAVRRTLAALGYQETINFSFVDAQWEKDLAGNADPIQLLNPIASHMNVMRSSLIASLLQVVKFNADRKASRVRVFEVGRVFFKDASVIDSLQSVQGMEQPMRVAGMAWGPVNELGWNVDKAQADFFDVKADVEALFAPRQLQFEAATHPALHPGRSARIVLEGQSVGWIGELHPQWRQQWELAHAPVTFELELDALLHKPVPAAAAVPKLQAVERDIAVVVKEQLSHQALMDCIWAAPTQGLLQDAVLFDVYRPAKEGGSVTVGEKSLAVRLIMQSTDDTTLTDVQIEQAVQAVVQQLTQQINARLRT